MLFIVNGYWKDDKAEFSDYLISSFDDVQDNEEDNNIFYYGLSETDLKNSCQKDAQEFIITSYERVAQKADKVFARIGFSDVVISLEDSNNNDIKIVGEDSYLVGYEDENGDECEEDGTYFD